MSEIVRTADEPRELTRVAFDEVGKFAGGIGAIHRGMADRVFGFVGPAGRPAKVVHDRVSAAAYGGMGRGFRLLGRGAETVVARRPNPDGRAVSTHPGGRVLLSILSGLQGDVLEQEQSSLVEPMSVRVGGEILTPRREQVAAAFPRAHGRIVIFLHGLMESEASWGSGGGPSYGALLERDFDITPVYVRYNTGRRISANGRSLSELLDALLCEWPVQVREVSLVGHSMGGLVARSACHYAGEDGADWVRHVRKTVSVGTPHMGAPLEQFVHFASAGLAALPETRPLASFLRRRSVGIRDLRQGSLVDEDWSECDPDELRAAACAEIPLLDGATHCFITATVTRSPRHPLGRMIGDGLVLIPSGSGRSRSRRLAFDEANGAHVGGAGHFSLLNHPAVYEQLRGWLAVPAA